MSIVQNMEIIDNENLIWACLHGSETGCAYMEKIDPIAQEANRKVMMVYQAL